MRNEPNEMYRCLTETHEVLYLCKKHIAQLPKEDDSGMRLINGQAIVEQIRVQLVDYQCVLCNH